MKEKFSFLGFCISWNNIYEMEQHTPRKNILTTL